MEKSSATNNVASDAVLSPTTTTLTNASTTNVEDAFKDFVHQLSNPTTVADFDRQVGYGGMTVEQHQQHPHQSIQTSLDQLGNDISDIKSSLVKRKTKISLLDVNEKVDQILQFLKDPYSSPLVSDDGIKMEP